MAATINQKVLWFFPEGLLGSISADGVMLRSEVDVVMTNAAVHGPEENTLPQNSELSILRELRS